MSKKLNEAAASIINEGMKNRSDPQLKNADAGDPPKAIRDPNMNDTGPAVVTASAPKKDYAKGMGKKADPQTKSADAGEPMKKLDSKYNVQNKGKSQATDKNLAIEEFEQFLGDMDEEAFVDFLESLDVTEEELAELDENEVSEYLMDKYIDINEQAVEETPRRSIADALEEKIELDVSEDIKAMFKGSDLSEEFKEKASTVFEAAVLRKVREIQERLAEEYNSILEDEIESIEEEQADKIEDFMGMVVREWYEDNQVAIKNNLKIQMAESLAVGLKNLLAENYIVPEESEDIVEKLAEENSYLTEALEEMNSEKLENHKYIQELEKAVVLNDVISEHNLSLTQQEKVRELAEEIDYLSAENYARKVNTLIESYGNGPVTVKTSDNNSLTEENITESETRNESVDDPRFNDIKNLANAIKNTVRK